LILRLRFIFLLFLTAGPSLFFSFIFFTDGPDPLRVGPSLLILQVGPRLTLSCWLGPTTFFFASEPALGFFY
jgi:hypothetical protein